MSNSIIVLMLSVSLLLGFIALIALLWGIKTKQFDDYSKFLDASKFDTQDLLNDAYEMELRKKEALNKNKKGGNFPPD